MLTAKYIHMARNVVLLCLDTVRYDYFERYADDLQSLADYSATECRTASTWSVPSHASMFTGSLPHEHGYHSATPSFEDLDREDTFLASLEDFRLVGVSANPYASPIFGFDQLFDEFHHVTSSMPYPDGLPPSEFWHESSSDGLKRYFGFLRACLGHDHPAKSLANGVASQLEKLFQKLPVAKPTDDGCKRVLSRTKESLAASDEPTFAFVNVMDVHGPLTNVRGYDQSLIADEHRDASPDVDALSVNMDGTFDEHEAEIAAYRDLYAAAVEYTTRQVAEFCASLDDDTAVVVTADHGEQLDDLEEKRRFGHVTPDLTEQLLHVPLAVVNDDVPVDEPEPISHLDLGRLVTAIATESDFEKRAPVAAEVAGLGVANPPDYHEDFDYWNRVSRCVYLDDIEYKYVWNSGGKAAHYQRENGEYTLEREGGSEIVPADASTVFSPDIEDVATREGDADIDANVESQLEELGYL